MNKERAGRVTQGSGELMNDAQVTLFLLTPHLPGLKIVDHVMSHGTSLINTTTMYYKIMTHAYFSDEYV